MAQQRIPQELEVELRAVKGELDLAKKTIDRYAHLGTKYGALVVIHVYLILKIQSQSFMMN